MFTVKFYLREDPVFVFDMPPFEPIHDDDMPF